MDLRANLEQEICQKPLERALIPTGLFIELALGSEAQVRPGSGLAARYGITVLNTQGTINADYHGEIKINLSGQEKTVRDGERTAQMIISKQEKAELDVVDYLEETGRGTGGFGHTGRK